MQEFVQKQAWPIINILEQLPDVQDVWQSGRETTPLLEPSYRNPGDQITKLVFLHFPNSRVFVI